MNKISREDLGSNGLRVIVSSLSEYASMRTPIQLFSSLQASSDVILKVNIQTRRSSMGFHAFNRQLKDVLRHCSSKVTRLEI